MPKALFTGALIGFCVLFNILFIVALACLNPPGKAQDETLQVALEEAQVNNQWQELTMVISTIQKPLLQFWMCTVGHFNRWHVDLTQTLAVFFVGKCSNSMRKRKSSKEHCGGENLVCFYGLCLVPRLKVTPDTDGKNISIPKQIDTLILSSLFRTYCVHFATSF